jgi:short-subunit dehydrogenase
MRRVLIIGATSRIAQETGICFARAGCDLFLVGRDAEKLRSTKAALEKAGARRVEIVSRDLTRVDTHQELIDTVIATLGGIDSVLIAHGVYEDQLECERSAAKTLDIIYVNFTSVVSLLTLLANYFEHQRSGIIAVITSIAGDRGRRTHYIYGSSKGALNIFLQGLRSRLYKNGVSVVTIKPGYVDTPMTASLEKNILFAKPSYVGQKIYMAMKHHKDVVYVPGFWRFVMYAVKIIPESLLKRMSF